jgi:hypothetical protein
MDRDFQSADWIGAYFEWQEASAAAPSAYSSQDSLPEVALDRSREAVLLAALRAESDCLFVLRDALSGGVGSSHALRLALETLDAAQWLLREEQHLPRYHA